VAGLDVDTSLLRPSLRDGRSEGGVFTFIARGPEIEALLRERYGRDGLCLKVFKQKRKGSAWDYTWSDKGVNLMQSTMAQNAVARYGLAPRVFDIVDLPDGRIAQVTEYVVDDGVFDKALARRAWKEQGLRAITTDPNPHNYVGGKMVDFQYYFLLPSYGGDLIKRAHEVAAWGSRSEPYQSIFGCDAQRDTGHRVEMMRLDELDLGGKTVLDVGCNLGAMCIEAAKRGALRVTGVDLPHVADLAYDVANWTGWWNIDYIGAQLPRERDKLGGSYDVIFALSCKQVQPVPWLFDLCREVLFWEGHVPDKEDTYRPLLEQHFSRVEFLGATRDHGPRPLFRCWK